MAERQWAGSRLADRQAERRRALLDAGLDLLGAEGGPAVGVRAVCRRARLTERYFYESFADRDALVAAVYDEVTERAHAALTGAVASVARTGRHSSRRRSRRSSSSSSTIRAWVARCCSPRSPTPR